MKSKLFGSESFGLNIVASVIINLSEFIYKDTLKCVFYVVC